MSKIRPLHKSGAVPILQEIQGLSLAQVADEALLKNAEILSEGEIETGSSGREFYFGSTLVAIDLGRSDVDFGPAADDPELLIRLASSSVLFRLRLARLARREAERRCAPRAISGITTDTEFKIEGDQFLVDINIECQFAKQSSLGDRTTEVAK